MDRQKGADPQGELGERSRSANGERGGPPWINYAALAADDVKALQAGSPSVPMRPALAKCATAFSEAGVAFAAASDEINARSYAAGRKKLDEALAQAQGCNAAFGIHGVTLPQPLAQHTVDSIQIAIIAEAITSLIK